MFGDVLQQTSYVCGRSTADIVCLGTVYSRHRIFGDGLQQTSYVWGCFTADIVCFGMFYDRHRMFGDIVHRRRMFADVS